MVMGRNVRIATMLLAVLLLAGGVATGCGDARQEAEQAATQDEAAADLEKAAETTAANVERSAETMKETYDEKRAEGEGRVEAAGDAYNKVLEEGSEEE